MISEETLRRGEREPQQGVKQVMLEAWDSRESGKNTGAAFRIWMYLYLIAGLPEAAEGLLEGSKKPGALI